jgi:pyruvate,water dikinase
MTSKLILPLQTDQASLERAGGKGANLAKLSRDGYPVPDGFLITTRAYVDFVRSNDLNERILREIAAIQTRDPAGLRAASEAIRGWFSGGTLSPELTSAIRDAYAVLGAPPVAVRSSATAEDLPGISFAGQQDTYLNVMGDDALLEATVNCWSSLWTARAIGYRTCNGIPHEDIALAVVVQEMVKPDASGVLFTANPLTGVRTETVIDATLGLGEALVSGQVEPDHYVVDADRGKILGKALGAKTISIRSAENGATVTVQEDASHRQALPDDQILQLATLSQRVAAEFSFPQDIEWAWAGGQLALLQSRPITTLYPLPEGMEPEPLRMMVSFAAVQGITEPITPLGQDVIRVIFAGGGTLFGIQRTYTSQTAVREAGERLWVDITPVVRNSVGRRIMPHLWGLVLPAARQAMDTLKQDPRLLPERGGIRIRTLRRLAGFLFPFWRNVLRSWHDPDGRRTQIQHQVDAQVETLRSKADALAAGPHPLAGRIALIHELGGSFPFAIPVAFSAVIAGMIPLAILRRLAKHTSLTGQESATLPLEVARGIPHNVTTEMDLSLWEAARAIQLDPPSLLRFGEASAPELAADYLGGRLPGSAQVAIARFLERYGMRGPGEIDLGRPRWREDPTHIMQTLQNYLRIEDMDQAPDAVFQRGAEAAVTASSRLEAAVRDTRGRRLKARIVRWATRRFRALAGLRESPKFFIVRLMGIIRRELLESGRDLVGAGTLQQADDLFFLRLSELEALARGEEPLAGEKRDWRSLIASRRANYEREALRRQLPRLLLSDGHAFYEGLSAPVSEGEQTLVGSPVSPGVVEGMVRIVLEPHQASLVPGDILVCPGTDPAWTPLFLAAAGLVMELGGMMTHGSVVAREYGIPAVVGTHEATQRLKTGQRIRLDGNAGRIVILGE